MEWQHSAVRKCFIKLSWISFNARFSSGSTLHVSCTLHNFILLYIVFPGKLQELLLSLLLLLFHRWLIQLHFPPSQFCHGLFLALKTIFPKWTCQTWYKSTDLGLYFVNKFFKGSCFNSVCCVSFKIFGRGRGGVGSNSTWKRHQIFSSSPDWYHT